jgi:hypothetical protein
LWQAVDAQAATDAALRKSEEQCAELRRAHAALGERIDGMTREVKLRLGQRRGRDRRTW